MNHYIASYLFIAVCGGMCVFNYNPSNDIDLAKVNQINGLYIFIESKPTATGEYLGEIKAGITLNGEPVELLRSMIKRCKKEYPKANALIVNSDYNRAECYRLE